MSKTSIFGFGIVVFISLLFSTAFAVDNQATVEPRKPKLTDLHLERTPFVEFLRFFSESTEWLNEGKEERGLPKFSIVYDSSIADDASLTLNARNLSPFTAIQLAAEMVGVKCRIIENSICLSSEGASQVNNRPFAIRIEPQPDNANLAIIAVTNQLAFHGVQFVYFEGTSDSRSDLCVVTSIEKKKWCAVAFRDGMIENIESMDKSELDDISRFLGNPGREILTNRSARIGAVIRCDENSDSFSYYWGRTDALQGSDDESFRCSYVQWKGQIPGSENNDIRERIVLSVGMDSLIVSKKTGGAISYFNVLCFDHRTKMPLGRNYQYTREGYRIWKAGPVLDPKDMK